MAKAKRSRSPRKAVGKPPLEPDVMLEMYRKHLTANHLDIGVGTGYFIDRCAPQARISGLP